MIEGVKMLIEEANKWSSGKGRKVLLL